jgi:hypothetical protein
MEFPDDILSIIKAYSKPMTKGDWRKGSFTATCNNHIKFVGASYLVNVLFKEMIIGMGNEWTEKLIPNCKNFYERKYGLFV